MISSGIIESSRCTAAATRSYDVVREASERIAHQALFVIESVRQRTGASRRSRPSSVSESCRQMRAMNGSSIGARSAGVMP